jgi:hypothetical protein
MFSPAVELWNEFIRELDAIERKASTQPKCRSNYSYLGFVDLISAHISPIFVHQHISDIRQAFHSEFCCMSHSGRFGPQIS